MKSFLWAFLVHQILVSAKDLVDCGVCKSVPESSCKWCDGSGGVAPVKSNSGGAYGGSPVACAAGLVNCGVCSCTTPTACNYCDGKGGPAQITSDTSTLFPRALVMLAALARLFWI